MAAPYASEVRELQPEARCLLRQQHAKPVADVTAKAIDYALSTCTQPRRYQPRKTVASTSPSRGQKRGDRVWRLRRACPG